MAVPVQWANVPEWMRRVATELNGLLDSSGVTAGTYGSATSIPTITIDQRGAITAASGSTIPVLDAGTYTPTLTNTTNITSSTAYSCQYMRVGNVVTVSGKVDITPTAVADTVLGISLPIASNFAAQNECGGNGNPISNASGERSGSIYADPTNDRAVLEFFPPATTTRGWSFQFTYRII